MFSGSYCEVVGPFDNNYRILGLKGNTKDRLVHHCAPRQHELILTDVCLTCSKTLQLFFKAPRQSVRELHYPYSRVFFFFNV